LGQRLFRVGDSSAASERSSVSAFQPPAPALKLRDFAPAGAQNVREPAKAAAPVKAVEPANAPVREPDPAPVVEPVAAEAPTVAATQPSSTVSSLAEARMKVAPPAPRPALVAPAVEAAPAPVPAVEEKPVPAPEPSAAKPAESLAPRSSSRRVPAPPAAAPRAEPEPEQPLLSPTSNARIGASFEALVESLVLRDPEMIERLAREMLRPMLKSWLDDNLPIVVERLVRAEIERIARGRG
jgi:cell pole-organizing protein PopZ